MNYQEIRERKIEEIAGKLRRGESVRPWAVMPYRNELESILSEDEEALFELRILVDFANESI